jgi:hypothetical protein
VQLRHDYEQVVLLVPLDAYRSAYALIALFPPHSRRGP